MRGRTVRFSRHSPACHKWPQDWPHSPCCLLQMRRAVDLCWDPVSSFLHRYCRVWHCRWRRPDCPLSVWRTCVPACLPSGLTVNPCTLPSEPAVVYAVAWAPIARSKDLKGM